MTRRIHHLNCGTTCPAAGRVPGLLPRTLVAHCLVVERDEGVAVVDTGFGTADVRDARLGRLVPLAIGARLDPAETLVAQLTGLGIEPRDVRDVVLTHLDLDHAGGLTDLPHARVHVHRQELQAALHPRLSERARYAAAQWAHGPLWVEHVGGAEDWFGFDAIPVLGGDVLLVPLPGHTRGHSAVAVRRPGGHWFLHAGDAYFHAGEKQTPRQCPPGLRAYQRTLAADHGQRIANLERLQELHAEHPDEVTVFSAHDRSELVALTGTTT